MKEVKPRDITQEDVKHLEGKDYSSSLDFNLLVDVAMVARKLYKEAARETKSQEEEPKNEIKKAYVQEEGIKENFSISEDFCCPAAAKKKRWSFSRRLNPLCIPSSSTLLEIISEDERLRVEKSLKKPRLNFDNKVTWNGVNGLIYRSLDDYKPDLPEYLKGKIQEENGSDVKLVIQKQVTLTDLDSYQNPASVPFSMLNCTESTDILTVSEQDYDIQRKPKGSLNGIKVVFVEPNRDRNVEVVFKSWVMAKENNNKGLNNVSTMYVLNGNGKWKDVFQKHKMEAGMIVQLWSFRYDGGELGFAMVIVGSVEKTEAKTNRTGNGHGSSDSWSGNGTGGSQGG